MFSPQQENEIEKCLISTASKVEIGLYRHYTEDFLITLQDSLPYIKSDRNVIEEVLANFHADFIISVKHLRFLIGKNAVNTIEKLEGLGGIPFRVKSFDEDPFEKAMGCSLSKFSLPIDLIGVGGSGMVFLIKDKGKRRALKVQTSSLVSWQAECYYTKKAGELGVGPKVLRCEECEEETGYLLEEYIKGKTLAEVVKEDKLTKKIVINLLNSYEILCTNLINHGDTHPKNAIVLKNEKVKWIDFGESSDLEKGQVKKEVEKYALGLKEELELTDEEEDWVKEWLIPRSDIF